MFGEIGGIAFSPDSEALFVALSDVSYSDTSYSSLVQFRKCDGMAAHLGRPVQQSGRVQDRAVGRRMCGAVHHHQSLRGAVL